jgi:hypothetical protein
MSASSPLRIRAVPSLPSEAFPAIHRPTESTRWWLNGRNGEKPFRNSNVSASCVSALSMNGFQTLSTGLKEALRRCCLGLR